MAEVLRTRTLLPTHPYTAAYVPIDYCLRTHILLPTYTLCVAFPTVYWQCFDARPALRRRSSQQQHHSEELRGGVGRGGVGFTCANFTPPPTSHLHAHHIYTYYELHSCSYFTPPLTSHLQLLRTTCRTIPHTPQLHLNPHQQRCTKLQPAYLKPTSVRIVHT